MRVDRSRFYESSSSSDSDSDTHPSSRTAAKKTIGFYILQCRSAMGGRDVDWVKLLHSLSLLAQKISKSSSPSRPDLCVASHRLCAQIESLMNSQEFPQDRQTRRRILSASQAKASIALQKKHETLLDTIRRACQSVEPLLCAELFTYDAKATLDGLERFFIQDPLAAIPIELLNTFNLVRHIPYL